jgi:hypothetical protein
VATLLANPERPAAVLATHQGADRLAIADPLDQVIAPMAPPLATGRWARTGASCTERRADPATLLAPSSTGTGRASASGVSPEGAQGAA